jgi:hypothetical protein
MNQNKNKVNAIVLIVVIILTGFVWALKQCNQSKQKYDERDVTTSTGDWRHHKLVYTKHARCRMECREISAEEIEYVLSTGIINQEKSKEENEEADGHCPTYALEGNTKDGQHIRIVFGACDKITKVITAIDLGNEHECNCR